MVSLVLVPQPRWRLWGAALLSGLTGSALILALVLWMNEAAKAPDQGRREHFTALEVATPKAKPKPKPKPKKRKQAKPKRLKPVPTPDLGAVLSGIDFGLPDVGLEFGADDNLLGNTDVDTMTQDAVDNPPQAVSTASFNYPPAAKKKGIQGYVVLSVLIDEAGTVRDAQVLESSPPGLFDDSALDGIRRWRFSPASYQGKPVKTWVQQKIVFQLG